MFGLPSWAAKAIGYAAVAAAVLALGAGIWHRTPVIGPAAVQKSLTAERDTARKTAADNRALAIAWATSAGKSEGLRRREKAVARAAVNAEAVSCTARVNEARRSALAIRSITRQETPRDPQGCPTRQLLSSDRLRDIYEPPSSPR